MNRGQRREVFEDTQKLLTTDIWPVDFQYMIIIKPQSRVTGINLPVINVVQKDCLTVAKEMKDRGLNPAVLVNASPKRPGGGVVEGSSAQEEDLFRRTSLSHIMFRDEVRKFYPFPKSLDTAFGIVVPKATVLKNPYYNPCEKWDCGFVFVPAIVCPALTKERVPTLADHRTKERVPYLVDPSPVFLSIHMILEAACAGFDALVLGAWGCGVFKNPPGHLANLFKEAIPNYQGHFKEISFAILDCEPSAHNPDGNLKPFQKVFLS
jgi:uncharacterized protein (TIGR02452 family)